MLLRLPSGKKSTDMQQLGERIKLLRKEKGMSQSSLAEQVGLSYAQIGRYETKGAQPSAEALKKIANTLGVSPDFLLYGSAEQKAGATLNDVELIQQFKACLLYTSPSPRDATLSRMPSSA